MNTYISILRGINVSGQKLIKMDALRKLYEGLGFQNVSSYVQSGNVVFSNKSKAPKKLEEKISGQIKKEFGFEVTVIVLTIEKLKHVVDNNPLVKDRGKEPAFMHVTFLASKPNSYDRKSIEEKKQKGEEIVLAEDVVYMYCPNGYGKSKLSNNYLETKLKTIATTRNWKTTNELLKIAQQIH